ncbi:MAG: autotransporter outer membrane beta-barrel domain-containing protein [Reyranellaceae bacterium]
MSRRNRFLNSVSGVALTAALAGLSVPALADTDSASGTAIPGLNQNITITSRVSVEAESSDPSNEVQVEGIVQGTAASNHLNAIGVEITGWDIEASGATSVFLAQNSGALAENRAIVNGAIAGGILNPDFAPGSGSFGVLVADDIQARDATAAVESSGGGNDSSTAIARNIIAATGSVAGSATNSTGVQVDGDVHASFADAGLNIDNFFDATNLAIGDAQAHNIVSISGVVGGEGAADGSVGFYVGGDVFAESAEIHSDGESSFTIPQYPFSISGASVYTTGRASLQALASNSVGVGGAIVGDGANAGIGVYVGGSVYAEGAWAAGEALSDGDQTEISSAAAQIIAQNTVSIVGTVGGVTGPAIGVQVGGSVYAEGAFSEGRAIARYADFYGEGGTTTAADILVVASNAVGVTGAVTTGGGVGVTIAGSVYAEGALAEGYAGANWTNLDDDPNVAANATAQATNGVVVLGSTGVSNSTGVEIGGSVYAEGAEADARADAFGNLSTIGEGGPVAVVASSTVTALASNSASVIGVVAASLTNAFGVDPIDVFAEDAYSNHTVSVSATSVDGLGATANGVGTGLASNLASVTGTIGDLVSGSTGVIVLGEVEAQDAWAYGGVTASASQTNSDTLATTGATAIALNSLAATNDALVVGILGDSVTGSSGVDIDIDVDADYANAYGGASASATVIGGAVADALATAEGSVAAENLASVAGILGVNAVDSYGVYIGEGVDANEAYGQGGASSYAFVSGNSGSATASADNTVAASNTASVGATLGDNALNSTGVSIAEGGVVALYSGVDSSASAYSYVITGQADGDSSATATNSGTASNVAVAAGVLGNAAEGSFGVYLSEGSVGAAFAEAAGNAYAFSTIDGGGDSDATSTATNNLSASNLAVVQGLVGEDALGSVGVWIDGGVDAFSAFAEGNARAEAYNSASGGDALATATNSVSTANIASVTGSLGNNPQWSNFIYPDGVYIGEGVTATAAFAEGYANADADVISGTLAGNATANATNVVAAQNLVSIVGAVGTGAEGSGGVYVGGVNFVFAPFFMGAIPAGAAAMNAFAEGSAFADANVSGGTGSAEATAVNNVTAANVVTISGSVGADASDVLGVGFEDGAVIAAFAEALGSSLAYASKDDANPGNATASAGGSVAATNAVIIVGTVGDASYGTTGVWIGEGPAGAGLAEGVGDFYAQATRQGVQSGNATASIGAEGAAASVVAVNAVSITGLVSGINGEGGGSQSNTGVYVGEGIGAIGALAEGSFGTNAYRDGDGSGAASATVFGSVSAANVVVISGSVTAGSSAEGAANGEGSSGVYTDGPVVALGAVALGHAYSDAYRSSDVAATGDATASTSLTTSAINSIVIGGTIGSHVDDSGGVYIGEGVTAAFALAEGRAYAFATNNGAADGSAFATATNSAVAVNSVSISALVGGDTDANDSVGVYISEGGVTATLAFAEGASTATASSDGDGDGSAIATASNTTGATNVISVSGIVGNEINDGSDGVIVGGEGGISASVAFAEGSAFAEASRVGVGEGIATATAGDVVTASNIVGLVGEVGSNTWNAFGIDPAFVNASNAQATSFAFASANGPAGSTASASSSAVAQNVVGITGSVGELHSNTTGVWIGGDVTAVDAAASATTDVVTNGAATGTGTAVAVAQNVVELNGSVASNGEGSTGIHVGGNVFVGGLGLSLSNSSDAAAGTTITSTGTGTMYNIVSITGDVGSGVSAIDSTGVYIGGNVEFGGSVSSSISLSMTGDGVSSVLQVIEAANIGTISGTVGATSSGSHGVYIGGNVQATNDLVSSIVIAGVDLTNDGTTRGVYIGGSVLTGDALNSQWASQSGSLNGVVPVIPDPVQIGDYVELAGSVFIGAAEGANPYGVAVGGGNDTVYVRDTDFQMEVVNGFDGGDNEVDGQDVITFGNAKIFVSNLDNFELFNVTNGSNVILTNPLPYIYAVQDEVNVNYSSILSFGDGGSPPPFPIASGAPVGALQLDTAVLTIGGVAGVKTPGPGLDDSILKAENNGAGVYTINAEVYNFGTITLSKVLSALRGTDPNGLAGDGATSFDSPAEQQFWATTGSWALDPTSAAGDVLTINGNYTAGSDIIVDAFVFKTGSASDTVVINGDVAGLTTIWVNNTNAFGQGALTGRGPTDGILLVDVNNLQDPAVVGAAFVLGNTSGWNWADPVNFPEPEMQVGAFVYDLQQGGADGRSFYLQSQLLDQVPAYTVMTSAIQQHFYVELGTLYQRMGELRHADYGSKANTSFFEFWARAYGADLEINPDNGFDFDMTTKGFMIGGDYAIRNWIAPQSRLHLGGFGGYGWTKLDNVQGASGDSDGKTDGYTLGLYATYFDTAKKGQGLYADAVLKFNFLDSKYDSSSRNTSADSDDFAWGASMEIGYGIGLGGNFIIQPQGQLTYMQTSKEKFKESSPGIPLQVERDKSQSLRGRAGLQLQNTWVTSGGTQFSPYVIGNVLHEFMGDNDTTVGGTKFNNDMGGTWFNAGAGFTVDFDNVGLYGHIEYNFGGQVDGLAGGLGVKVKLGGSSPAVAPAAAAPTPPPAPRKNFLVFFDFDRSNITADAARVIDEAATTAKTGNVARIQLTAHTDRAGSEQYNMALSMRRGEAVKRELVARGIPANSIAIIARGESQPLVPTADGVREPQNRRVEILL